MSYIFQPSVTAALTISRRPNGSSARAPRAAAPVVPLVNAPVATAGDVYPDVPAELYAKSIESKLLAPMGDFVSGSKRGIFTVLVALLAAETDRALSKRTKRFDSRYAFVAGLAAIIAREIIE